MVGRCFFIKICARQSNFGSLPDPLAKPLDYGADLHSSDAHAWSDAKENRLLSLSAGSERFFRRPRQKQHDSERFPLREHPHDALSGKLPGGRIFGRFPRT